MKKSNKKGWEEHIKSRFQDFEESPEDQLWSNISKNIQPERKWPFWPVAAILPLVIGAWMALLYQQAPLNEEKNNSTTTLTEDDEGREKSYLAEDRTTRINGEASTLKKQENPKSGDIGSYKEEDTSGSSVSPQEKRQKPASYQGKEQNKPESGDKELTSSSGIPMASTLKAPFDPSKPSASGEILPGEKAPEEKHLFSITPKTAIWLDKSMDDNFDAKINVLPLQIPEASAIAGNIAPREEKMEQKKEKAAFEVWGALNPMLTYRQVKPNLEDDIQILSLEENQTLSVSRVGLQTSVGFSYFLTPNLAIKAGAFYRFTQNKWSYSYFSGNPDSLVVQQLNDNSISTQPVFTRNLEKVNETKQHFGALVGLQIIAHGPIRKTLNLELQASKEPSHAHTLYFLAFDIELEKHLFKQFYLNAGPSFIWELNGFTPNEIQPYEIKPYGLGLKLGLSYKLNR